MAHGFGRNESTRYAKVCMNKYGSYKESYDKLKPMIKCKPMSNAMLKLGTATAQAIQAFQHLHDALNYPENKDILCIEKLGYENDSI